ncbi:MAG: ABC transporter permease [Candidatus Acidiferrales bacterium]
MFSFWQDVRYSLRMILKAPGFAAIAILTLALGIGANTTIFSWINSALLNPIPGISEPNRVVVLTLNKPGEKAFGLTYPDVEALRNGQKSFEGIAASGSATISLTGKGKPQRVPGVVVSANYFDVLGVRPILGRGFLPDENHGAGSAPVAVISYGLWRSRFGADPNVVGQKIEINKNSYTIVGVMPPIFQGSETGIRTDMWVPTVMVAQVKSEGDLMNDHHLFWLRTFGRSKPGVTPKQAEEEATLRLKPEVEAYPEEHKGHENVTVYPLWRNPFGLNSFLATLLPVLMSIAGVVLLLACANVANLTLVRSMRRTREIAIRIAMGASRWRLVRQLLVESLILSLAGGAVALLITFWTAGTLMKFLPLMTDEPVYLNVSPDRVVLLATLIISLATAMIFGILPALRSSKLAPVSVLKEETFSASGGVRKARLAGGLVVAQISLSLLLLICSGLLIRSFLKARELNLGFNGHNVLLMSYDTFTVGYSGSTGVEFNRQLIEELRTTPGVESVMVTNRVPPGLDETTSVNPQGYVPRENESMETEDAVVSPNYFRTMEIPLVKGRDFTSEDTLKSQRVVIVSEAFVNRYWPNQEAIGKKLFSDLPKERLTVVGVARDIKVDGLNENPTPFVYLPLYQFYDSDLTVAVRTSGNPLAYRKAIEEKIHSLNNDVNVSDVTTLESREQIASIGQRIAGTFVGIFGLLALVLATVGIYGVTAYTTRQRSREIGIRMAFGATWQDVLRLVLGRAMKLTALGVGLGLALAFLLTRFLSSLLLGVTSTDALTFVSVAILLCAVTILACFFPARRAMRIDPMVALRYE